MVKKVVVTGGAGQIAYSLLFRIAHGDLFGSEEEIDLRICDLPEKKEILEGIAMELVDSAFPLLQRLTIGHDQRKLFDQVDLALLVGAKPRTKGMERADLLQENGKIFVTAGEALNEAAAHDAKVIVVGNPCNTNCLIAMTHAPRLPRKHFHAMMRLDQNRGMALLAQKSGRPLSQIKKMCIWGNHSASQVPDYHHVEIAGRAASEVLGGVHWLQQEFISSIQKRGAEILAKRGASSAASAASSLVDAVRSLYQPTEQGNWYTSAVCTDGNPYGIEENLIFGFPLQTLANGNTQIVKGLEWDYYIKEKIAITQKELLDERECVRALLKGKVF